MKQALIAALFGMLLVAAPSLAQVTGAPVLRGIYDQLSRQTAYQVEMKGNIIVLRDRSTGAELVSVSDVGQDGIVVRGVVGHVVGSSDASTIALMRNIAMFNMSSPVGTLRVDERTGDVMMSHYLNPRFVPASSMANVAVMCSDVVRGRVGMMFN